MRTLEQPHPGPLRLILGFVLAPLVPAVLVGTVMAFDIDARFGAFVAFIALMGGYPVAIALGVPAYVVIHRYFRPRLATFALAGGCIATLPWFTLIRSGPGNDGSAGACPILNGVVEPWCGILLEGLRAAPFFTLGVVGGVVFWLCTMWRNPVMARAADEDGGTSDRPVG